MDPATIVGILVAFGALYAMITLEHASVQALLLPAPMVLVFGATLAIGIAGGTFKDFLVAVKAVPAAMMGKTTPPQDTIDSVVVLAEKARSEGLLALEEEANTVGDPFLRGALQNIADGTDGEELREILEDEGVALPRCGFAFGGREEDQHRSTVSDLDGPAARADTRLPADRRSGTEPLEWMTDGSTRRPR